MATARGEGSSRYEVVAGSREQIQAVVLQAIAIFHHTTNWSLAALLGATKGLIFEGRNTTCLIAWGGVLAYRLAMRQEVVLEVIDHGNGLIKERLCFATVHENRLSTKHLGYLCEYRRTALGNEPIREFAYQRISGDARETIGTATLQTNAQLRYGYLFALILFGDIVEFAENLHTSLHLVVDFLGDEEFDTVFVIVAKHGHEVIGLVVLATQTQYEHGTGIGMQTDIAKHLSGVLMIA